MGTRFAHTHARGRGRSAAAVAGALAALALTGCGGGAAQARTFYVSPAGSDGAPGTSPASAWRTVARVNRARLRPGDTVLLRGGAAFRNTLMPRHSGRPGRPIAFASYGPGRAKLLRGVWFGRGHDLAFDRLALPGASLVGHGSRIAVTRCAIARGALGIFADGTDWRIERNKVHRTGDSGLILMGARMAVTSNRIEDTGRDGTIGYPRHGIYLKAADSRIAGNRIHGFADNGISARYRNGTIVGNEIARGPIGIAWFQNDGRAGTSRWLDNRISATTSAGIYVSPADSAGPTRERILIARNVVRPLAGLRMDLRGLRAAP